MAEQIHYRPEQQHSFNAGLGAGPAQSGDAEQELRRLQSRLGEVNELLDHLHDSGVLRWLNGLVGSLPEVSTVALEALNNERGRAGIRNLMALVWQLGRYDPETVENMLGALQSGAARAEETAAGEYDSPYAPPGITGAFKMLRDEQLWQTLAPLLEGARAFSQAAQATQGGDSETASASSSDQAGSD